MQFVEQKEKLYKKRNRIENGKSHTPFYRDKSYALAHVRISN